MVWRSDKTSLNLFPRGGLSPSDRNLISFYADGGAGFKGPLPGRADDVLTFGVSYAKISKDAAALDQDTLALNGPPYPIRDQEVVFELSYQAQIAPWWIVQPDLQYIVHPGGNVPDPNNPNVTVGNALVAGVRSTDQILSLRRLSAIRSPSRTARKRVNSASQSCLAADADDAQKAAAAETQPLRQHHRLVIESLAPAP